VRDVLQLIARILPPWPSLWRCALTGAFGIASGFAVFLLWLDEISRGPVRFVVALGVAVLVSFTFESLRDDLEGHAPRWHAPRLLVLTVLLTMAELFVMGFHSTVSITPAQLSATLATLLGEDVTRWHAMSVIGVWLVLGGAIAVGLGATIFNAACEIPESEPLSWSKPAVWGKPMLRSALRGGLTGALAGPLCMLLYIFVVRFVFEYIWILGKPEEWRQHLQGASQAMTESGGWAWLVAVPIEAIQLLDRVFGVFGRVGPFLTLATLVAILLLCARLRAGRTFVVILVGVLVVYGYPVLAEMPRLLRLAGLMAYLWAVPGLLLGALTPWLKRPSGYPRLWGMVAFAAAGILVIGSLAIPWFLAPAAVFGAVGVWFRRSVEVEQYWAVLALSVATNVFGATHVVTRADFFHIQRDSFELTRVKPRGFPYQAVKVTPDFAAALRKAGDPSEFLKAWSSDPSLRQSPLFPPGFVPQFSDLYRAPWAQATPPAETMIAEDRAVLRRELARITGEQKDLAGQMSELQTMEDHIAQENRAFEELRKLDYQDHHKRLQDLDLWTTVALARREKIVADASKAVADESKATVPGRATYPGELSPAALAGLPELRKEQATFQAEQQKLLAMLQQVTDRAGRLSKPLARLQQDVGARAAALHALALRAFEVSLTASSGFWITLGLLASWSIRRQQTEPLRVDEG